MALFICVFFFFQAEDGIRDYKVTGVQTCALPISAMPCNHCGGRDYDARQSAARTSGIFCAWRGHALLLSADRPRSTGADEYDGRSIPARTAPGTSFPMKIGRAHV